MIADTSAQRDNFAWESLKKGDQEALAHIYESNISGLLNYGMTLTLDKDLVKDCIQELFITIWNQRSRLSPANSVRLYLLVSLKRLILKKLKKVKATKDALSRQTEYGADHELSAEYHIVENEKKRKQKDLLLNEIYRLPKRQQEAIFLRFYEELSYEDIASMMNLNYQGARNIIYKSVKTLRENIQYKWPHILFPVLFLSYLFF